MTKRKQKLSPQSSPRAKRRPLYDGTIHGDVPLSSLEAAFQENDAVAVDQTSATIGSSCAEFVSDLSLRCASLARAGKFTEAHRDAELMAVIAPSLAQSYLCKGNVYAMEGRQAAAVRVYEKGLMTTAETDPHYTALKRAMQSAKTSNAKRVDFISMLPKEIVAHILGDFELEEIIELIHTSTKWRDRITNSPDIWRYVHLSQSRAWIIYLLPVIGRHIQSLSFWNLWSCQEKLLLQGMIDGRLADLREFEADYEVYDDEPDDRLPVALWRVRHTLTDLSLTFDEKAGLKLATILSVCPNLLSLSYTAHQCELGGVAESPLAGTGQLTSLELRFKKIPTTELEAILRWSPNIRRLAINGYDTDALEAVARTLPYLKQLNCNSSTSLRFLDHKQLFEPQVGLLQCDIPQCQPMQAETVYSLLEKSQNTLTTLTLGLPQNPTLNLEAWHSLQHIKFHGLQELTVRFGSVLRPTVVNLMSHCTSLRRIRFEKSELTEDVFEVLKTMDKLETCSIISPSKLSNAGLKRLFKRHTTLGAGSSLRHVELIGCRKILDDVLSPLAHIPTIENLNVDNCQGFTKNGINRFLESLNENTSLRGLTFRSMHTVTDSALFLLAKILNLEELSLTNLVSITDFGINYLLDNAICLRYIYIYRCPSVSSAAEYRICSRRNGKF